MKRKTFLPWRRSKKKLNLRMAIAGSQSSRKASWEWKLRQLRRTLNLSHQLKISDMTLHSTLLLAEILVLRYFKSVNRIDKNIHIYRRILFIIWRWTWIVLSGKKNFYFWSNTFEYRQIGNEEGYSRLYLQGSVKTIRSLRNLDSLSLLGTLNVCC